MIVKNEEAFLENMLSSCDSYCDELIVVDTGSTDRTKNIAENLGARVFDYQWNNNFADARNFALEKCSGDWIIVLDADEEISDLDWEQLHYEIQKGQSEAFDICQVNYTKEQNVLGFIKNEFGYKGFENYPGYTESWLTRVFKNNSGFTFSGVVHEHLFKDGSIVHGKSLPVYIHHHGQALSPEKMKEKKNLYLELGTEKFHSQTGDYKSAHELGVAFLENESFPEARKYFEIAYQLDPKQVQNLISLGTCLQRMGLYAEGLNIFKEAIDINPNHPFVYAGYGLCLLKLKRFDESIIAFQKQIENNPDFSQGRQWLYDAYNERRKVFSDIKETISVCYIVKNEDDILELSLKNVKPHVDEIIVVDTGSTDNTVEVAKKYGAKVFSEKWRDDFSWARNQSLKHATSEWVLILDADEVLGDEDWRLLDLVIHSNRSEMYYLVQTTFSNEATVLDWKPNDLNFEDGKKYSGYFESPLVRLFRNTPKIKFLNAVHEHAYHDDRTTTQLRTDVRIYHYGKFRSEERMQHKSELYHKIGLKKLEDMPNDAQAYYELAAQLMELGRYDEVEAYFKKTFEIDPQYADALIAYGSFLYEQNRIRESLDTFMKVLMIKPEDPQVYIFTSTLLIDLKKYDLALSMLQTAKKVGGENNVALLLNEAVINLHFKFYEKSQLILNRALEINPNYAPIYINLALVYKELNDFQKANEFLDKAIEKSPNDPMVHKLKGEVQFNLKDYKNALNNFLNAYRLNPEDHATVRQIVVTSYVIGNKDQVNEYENVLAELSRKTHSTEEFKILENLYRIKNDEEGLKRMQKLINRV